MQPTPPIVASSAGRSRSELSALLVIAAPLAAAYLAEFMMFLTTKIVVGQLGSLELAGVGLAADIMFEGIIVGMGLLSVVGVLVAHAEGAGKSHEGGHAARQGLIVATMVGVPTMVLLWNMPLFLAHAGQDPRVVEISIPYMHAVAASALPVFWFAVLRSFVAALARTRPVMVITVAAVGVNYALAFGLVHGRFGLPALGVAGAGWATTIVSWGMFAALSLYVFRSPALRGHGLFRGSLRIDRRVCADIARLGIPVAGLVFLESGLFMAVSLLSGALGAHALATSQILLGWTGLPFVLALGLADATMVRVAYAMGRERVREARRSGIIGITAGVGLLGALVVVPLGVPELIVSVFLDSDDPDYARIETLASRLLVIVAIFQIFDGVQAVASRALRGLRDTVAPLWIAAVGYWLIGIGGGWLFAFPLGYSLAGLWWGLAAGLIVAAIALTWRFLLLTRPVKGSPG